MALAILLSMLKILSWVHVHFTVLGNETLLGGSPIPFARGGNSGSGGFGFWPSDDNDYFGGGGGGKWELETMHVFSRPHPIELFKFADDKLAASLKAINEEHYLALEWTNILPSYVTDETSSKTTEMICHSLPCF